MHLQNLRHKYIKFAQLFYFPLKLSKTSCERVLSMNEHNVQLVSIHLPVSWNLLFPEWWIPLRARESVQRRNAKELREVWIRRKVCVCVCGAAENGLVHESRWMAEPRTVRVRSGLGSGKVDDRQSRDSYKGGQGVGLGKWRAASGKAWWFWSTVFII